MKTESRELIKFENWERLFNAAIDPLMLLDLDGNIITLNEEAAKLLNKSVDELIGWNSYDFMAPNESKFFKVQINNIARLRKPVRVEKELFGRTFDHSFSPIFDEQEKVEKIAVFSHDITERKKIEKQLRLKSSAIESSNNAIALADLEGKLIYVNPTFLKEWGYTNINEVIGKNSTSFWQTEEEASEVIKVLQNKGEFCGELVARSKNGKIFYVQISASMVMDDFGEPICMMASFVNSTASKTMENELKESVVRLKESEKKVININAELETLIDLIPGNVFSVDKKGLLTRVNQNFANFNRLSKEDAIGKSVYDVFPEDQAKKIREVDLDIINTGKAVLNLEETVDAPHGKMCLLTNKVPYYNKDGEVDGIIGLVIDITERKKGEARMRLLSSAVEQSTEGVAVSDLKGNLLFANNAFSDMHGYTSNELIGNHVSILHTPDQMPSVEAANQQILERGEFIGEIWHLRKDGSVFPSLTHNSLFRDDMDNPVGIIGTLLDITENKEIEEKLRKSEEKYKGILENMQEGYLEVDLNGTFTFFNDSFIEITGYSRNELLGADFRNYINEENKNKLIEAYKNVYETGIPVINFQFQFTKKNGEEITCESSVYLRRDSDGNKIGFSGITRNFSERFVLQQKIKESQERLELAMMGANLGMWDWNIQTGHVNFNQRWANMLGYTLDEIESHVRTWEKLVHPEDMPKVEEVLNNHLEGKISLYQTEHRLLTKSGKWKWILDSGKVVEWDQNGEPLRATGIHQDITARKEAEAKLKESEEKYRFISENANDIISIFDKKMNLIFINEEYQKISGFSQHEVVGKTTMRFVHPDDYSQTLKEFQKLIRNGSGSVEFRMRCKDNSYIWVEANGKILVDDESRELKMLLVTRDIDKRKKLEQKLRKSEEKYRLITENANDLIFILNQNMKLEYINENVLKKMLGFSEKDIIGKSNADFIFSEDIDRTIKSFRKGLKSGQGMVELRCLDKVGLYHWLEIKGKVFIDQDGKTKGLLIAREITERKKREEELEKTHSKLNQIFNITIPLCVIDKKFNIIQINNTFSSIFNEKREEIIGRKCYDIIPGSLCNTPECSIRQILGGKDHWDYEKDLELANETKIICNMRAVPYRGPDGEIIGVIQNYTDITARKKIEDMLKLNKERYSLATNAAKVGVWDWNLENGEFYLDPNIKMMLGYSDEEIPNDLDVWVKYVHPDDSKGVMEAAQAHLEGKTSEYIYQHRMLHKDGSFRWIQVRGRAIRDAQGNAIRMVGTDVDITALKKVEKAIQKRNREFSALLEASRAVLEHKDFKTSSRAIFDSCARLIGTTDGFIGLLTPDKKTIQVLSLNTHGTTQEAKPDLTIPIRGVFTEVLSSKKVKYQNKISKSNWKNNLQLPGGHIDLKNFMFTPLIMNDEIEGLMGLANKPGGFNEDDAKLTTAFVKIATMALINSQILVSLEKSEQKYRQLSNILEEKVEERTQELKKSEEKIQNMINNISDILMEGDIDGAITFLSPQIYDIIGYQPKELIGIEYVELIHPEDKLTYDKLINRTPKAGNNFSLELRILHKKGYYIPISINGSVEEINNKLKMFVIIRDITEKRKIDEMMKSEIKKLKELDQIRSDLIRRISHELKTPLISIFSGSQYLLDHSIDIAKDQTYRIIELIHMGGYRLKSLVDNLILAYYIDSKELNLSLARKNIIQIIKNCVEDMVFQAKKRKIFINIELLKELYIEVDNSTIKRAISNIISNAVKNTPPNGNIFVSTFEHPNYIDIIVKDDGVGLTKKEKPFLFKRFGKIERYGKGMDVDIEGAGLGLYIANEIVKLHNGEIIVESKGRNKGSTFTIRLHLS